MKDVLKPMIWVLAVGVFGLVMCTGCAWQSMKPPPIPEELGCTERHWPEKGVSMITCRFETGLTRTTYVIPSECGNGVVCATEADMCGKRYVKLNGEIAVWECE